MCVGEPPAALLLHTRTPTSRTPTSRPPLSAQAAARPEAPGQEAFYTEACLSSPDAQGVAPGGAAPGAGGGREEGLPRPQEGARLLAHLDSRTSGVAPPPGLGRSALTWQVDVCRCAGLAAATGLGAAVLQDVLDGRHAAPCGGRGRLGGLQAAGGPAIPRSPDPTPTPPCSPGTQKQILYYAFFLFPFLLPTPHTAWSSVLFLLEKHPMPTLKRPSAIFQDGQGGAQLQAHSGAFTRGAGSSSLRVRPQLGPALCLRGPQRRLDPKTGPWRPLVPAWCAGRKELPPLGGEAEA